MNELLTNLTIDVGFGPLWWPLAGIVVALAGMVWLVVDWQRNA